MATLKTVLRVAHATETMSIDQETEMTAAEIDTFLGRHETGVLALARSDEPYAVPISYGYDGESRTFYMRLVSTPESEKRRFLTSEPAARLVVYDRYDDAYRSVVAVGTLQEISPEELTVERIEQYGEARRPLFEIWAETRRELDIDLYELLPTSISGRRTTVERDDELV